jgi:hypothetical protein
MIDVYQIHEYNTQYSKRTARWRLMMKVKRKKKDGRTIIWGKDDRSSVKKADSLIIVSGIITPFDLSKYIHRHKYEQKKVSPHSKNIIFLI